MAKVQDDGNYEFAIVRLIPAVNSFRSASSSSIVLYSCQYALCSNSKF